jgi:thioredoxin reductase
MERCFADGSIVPLLGTEVVSIDERHVTLNTPEGPRQLINDRVIVQIGGQPPSELLRTIGIELVEKRGEA